MLIINEKQVLEKSLASGITMKFNEFVEFNDINIDIIKVDKFFHNIENNIPILIDETLIKYFGYADNMSEDTSKQIKEKKKMQKLRLIELFENNFSEYKNNYWWIYKRDEYENFLRFAQPNHKNIKDLSPKIIQKLYPLNEKKKGQQPTYM